MDARHKTVRASRFVLSTLKPMERIAIDTIGPLSNDMGFKYIIIIIDTFTRYVELFPKQKNTAIAAADALCRPTCRSNPLEIVTDFDSQLMNQSQKYFKAESSIRYHATTPYSKKKRAYKEVNRHIRKILFDKGHFKTGPDYFV